MTTARKRLLLIWLACHLFCCALFALCWHKEGFWVFLPSGTLTPVRLYGAFTGASNSYGFFSPDVSPQLRARFSLAVNGKDVPVPIFPPMNHEAELRVSNLVDAQWDFGRSEKNTAKNRALAASYAGKLLDRHPEASAATVFVEYFSLPPVAQVPRPASGWVPNYSARFERAGAAATATTTGKP